MKETDGFKWVGIVLIAVVVAGAGMFFALGGGKASTIEGTIDAEGNVVGPWTNTIVNYNLLTSDKFTGADVNAVAKVYDDKPEEWGNPRGDFDEAKDYTVYTASSGTVAINKEMPGKYYAVLTADGYNTEFVELTIPDGTGRGDIADYNANPDAKVAELSLVGSVTDEDFAFTLVNDSSADEKDTILLTLDANTELKGWKVIINDEEGFTTDTDGDGVYDEGVSRFEVTVDGKTVEVFNPNKGIDEFDSNDEYTIQLDNFVVSDGDDLVIKVEIDAVTGDYTGANDEVWGEGEGVLSYIKIYDMEGNLFSTVDVTA